MAADDSTTDPRPCEVCGEPTSSTRESAGSIAVEASAQQVYDLVSDIARTGEWSPICVACEWDDGQGPTAGSFFTGHNRTGDSEWSTRSQVEVAEPGREFAWLVNGGLVRWSYAMAPEGDGSRLTESWEFTQAGLQMFHDKWGEEAHVRIDLRTQQAIDGIPVTLAALKKVAEA